MAMTLDGIFTMNLIFLNRFFYPDHSATSQMLSDLVFGLRKRGHYIRVIASRHKVKAADT